MKITLTSEESIRLEPTPGPMTIEAPSADRLYSPFHMLGGSLAFCIHSVLVSWASHAGIETDGLVLEVAWTFGEQPQRIAGLRVGITWPELPASRRAAAQRVAELCPIHATLTHPPAIAIEVGAAATASPAAATPSGVPDTAASEAISAAAPSAGATAAEATR